MINSFHRNRETLLSFTVVLLLAAFIFQPLDSFAQVTQFQPPKNMNEVKSMGEKTGRTIIEKLPGALRDVWRNDVLSLWNKMWEWLGVFWKESVRPYLRNIWNSYLKPTIQNFINRIKKIIGKKVEENKPQIQKEFQKKKQETTKEIKQQVPNVTKTLRERFREIIK